MALVVPRNSALQSVMRDHYTAAEIQALRGLLEQQGVLTMRPLASGLFSAAVTTEFSEGTNYRAAWVRDNVHVAFAHLANGRPAVAVAAWRALLRFFRTQRGRFESIIERPELKAEPQRRPHIRFDGERLRELDQKWSHAQNDALGYFFWLGARLMLAGVLLPADLEQADWETLALFPRYFRAIEYWQDEDNGHWEEAAKIEASSIGVVVASLRAWRMMKSREGAQAIDSNQPTGMASIDAGRDHVERLFPGADLDELIERGEAALSTILPAECVQPESGKSRDADAALLFLIYPLEVIDGPTADAVLARIDSHLLGPVGIRRYRGDSFYCRDYERLIAAGGDDPTRDFSDDMSGRDALLRDGEEAQWCIFDPILSVVYGQRFARTGDVESRRRQWEHLNRALAQITRADPPRCEAFQCPELYYIEDGELRTSRATPLLWTQANLWTALEVAAATAATTTATTATATGAMTTAMTTDTTK
jgi:phosphorylase kinase alpha/beta subunit